MRFAVSFFCGCEPLKTRRAAVSRLKLAVLIVSDMHNLRYRRALTAHPIDVNADLFLGNIKRSEKHEFSDRFCYTILAETDIIIEDKDSATAHNSAIIRRKCCSRIFLYLLKDCYFIFLHSST